MDLSRVRELRLADPFRPFYLILQNGERLLIDVPESVGIAPDGSHMGVLVDDINLRRFRPDQVKGAEVASEQVQGAQ